MEQSLYMCGLQAAPNLFACLGILLATLSRASSHQIVPEISLRPRGISVICIQRWSGAQVICTKVRDADKRIVRLKEGEPRGRHVVIVDDLVQSGGTLIECQKLLASQVRLAHAPSCAVACEDVASTLWVCISYRPLRLQRSQAVSFVVTEEQQWYASPPLFLSLCDGRRRVLRMSAPTSPTVCSQTARGGVSHRKMAMAPQAVSNIFGLPIHALIPWAHSNRSHLLRCCH